MERRVSKVYQVLCKPRLVAGVEYPLFAANLCFAVIFLFALHFWYWIPVAYLIHKVLQAVAKSDPLMRPIFITFSHQADEYVPWPSIAPRRGLRPRNFGRGDLW